MTCVSGQSSTATLSSVGEARRRRGGRELRLRQRTRVCVEVLEDPDRFMGPVTPELPKGQRAHLVDRRVAAMEQPVAHLDRVDDTGSGAVRDEGSSRRDPVTPGAEVVSCGGGNPVEGQVVVATDHEPQREPRPEVEPELLDQGDASQVCAVRKGQACRQHSIVVGQLPVAVDPDPVVESHEVSCQHPSADAELARTRQREGSLRREELGWQRRHRPMRHATTSGALGSLAYLWIVMTGGPRVDAERARSGGEPGTVVAAQTVPGSPLSGVRPQQR